jgi:hypothetical protein
MKTERKMRKIYHLNFFNRFTVVFAKRAVFVLSHAELKKGDMLPAVSGYPHRLDFPQKCTLIFSDNVTIGVRDCLKVDKFSFRKIKWMFRF